jgi:hypothetical protein
MLIAIFKLKETDKDGININQSAMGTFVVVDNKIKE